MRNRLSVSLTALLAIGCTVFLAANLSFAGKVDLPKTGQSTCYDASGNVIPCQGTGEDGEMQAGVAWPEPRFTDNGDGTITDHLTGLMWLKDANCFGSRTWQGALDAVANLNANPGDYTCGGYAATYNDWALPNVNELESLTNAEVSDSASWLEGEGFVNVQSNVYGSSTTSADGGDYAWVVCMSVGHVHSVNKSLSDYVWPVRAVTAPPAAVWSTGQTTIYAAGDDGDLQRGAAWPSPRFTDNGDGTVTDNLTGLMWLKNASCFGSKTWQGALDAVANLNANPGNYSCGGYAAGYNDWRLPNRKELHSLTDFSRYFPALPEGHPFLDVQSFFYWSSTTYASNTGDGWVVYMGDGLIYDVYKSNHDYVWPVRAGQSGSLVHLDIKANGSDGPVIVGPSDPVSIDISLNPGDQGGVNAEWWIVVQWPFGMFWKYYSYVYPTGWLPGIKLCIEMPLIDLGPINVLTATLPPDDYEFFFVLDDKVDGIPEGKWVDSVRVKVE